MPPGLLLLSVHSATVAAMAGVLWVVQLAVYPLFDGVEPARFTRYHQRYTASIGRVVAPLMLVEAGTADALLWRGFRPDLFLLSLAFLAAGWVSTAAVQVPLHRRLARGYEEAAHHRLVRSNWVRTIAWTARAGLVLALIR